MFVKLQCVRAGYMAYVFFSSSLPGLPVWQTPPEVLQEVLLESLDFFYLNSALTALGLSPIPAVAVSRKSCSWLLQMLPLMFLMRACPSSQVHPVSLGLFNFVNAWCEVGFAGVRLCNVANAEARSRSAGCRSMMFWPVMLADRKGAAVRSRFQLWLGTQVGMLLTLLLSSRPSADQSPRVRAVPDQRLLHSLHGVAGVHGRAEA
jgi:hypothetical protein